MKIAFIVTDLSNIRIGGISRVATEVGANLAALGHEVVAYVLDRRLKDQPDSYRGITLRYIESFPSLNPDYPVLGFSHRAFAKFCADASAEQFDVLQTFNLNGFALTKFRSRLRELNIPCVIASYETIAMDVKAKANEFKTLPSLKTLGQIVFESILAIFYEKKYLKAADNIITEDQNTTNALIAMGMDADKIHLIPSGVDISLADKAVPPKLDIRQGNAGPIIGYIGRVDPRKGVQYLIKAMSKVRRRYPKATLFLAGGSRHGYEEVVQKLITQNDLAHSIKVLGRVDGDILPYYKLADLIVIPSLSEGIPITLGEAMASRIPVVISKLPGVLPYIKPQDLVFWASIGDHDDLAEAIIKALDDPQKEHRTNRARKFIEDFSWESVALQYLSIYSRSLTNE